ncbi:MAG: response regulator, partial [Cyanobacteria bacterium J06648_11]
MNVDILIVSNHKSLSQLVQMELNLDGFRVLTETDSTMGLMTIRKHPPRLLILDTDVPGLSAKELCSRLHSTNPNLKILLIADSEEVETTDSIADDYVFKPVSLTEILLRVKLCLCPKSSKASRCLMFEDISLNLDTRNVYRG